MTTLLICNPAEYIPKVRQLILENWAETGFDFEFNPNVEGYQRLFDLGMCFSIAAFSGDEIIGYCTVCVVPHPHNPSIVVASNDALFVRPEYRNGMAAGRLILAAEREAKHRGASRFAWHCRAETPLSEMLIAHGYVPVDTVVMKGL